MYSLLVSGGIRSVLGIGGCIKPRNLVRPLMLTNISVISQGKLSFYRTIHPNHLSLTSMQYNVRHLAPRENITHATIMSPSKCIKVSRMSHSPNFPALFSINGDKLLICSTFKNTTQVLFPSGRHFEFRRKPVPAVKCLFQLSASTRVVTHGLSERHRSYLLCLGLHVKPLFSFTYFSLSQSFHSSSHGGSRGEPSGLAPLWMYSWYIIWLK